jgi:hypothetical protein
VVREPPRADVREDAPRRALDLPRPVAERLRVVVPFRDRPPDRRLRAAVARPPPRDAAPRWPPERRREVRTPSARDAAVSRPISLLKFDRSPPEVTSSYTSARLDASNFWNQSSHEISRSLPAPLKPGKSIRIIPTSSPRDVPITSDGFPPRSSAQLRICSWSVVVLERFCAIRYLLNAYTVCTRAG